MKQPSDVSLIYGIISTTVINQLFDYSQKHTHEEVIAEVRRLEENPDEIPLNIDSFIADQCVSDESIESFRRVYQDPNVHPADVARRVFSLIERFPAESLKKMKSLAVIIATTTDDQPESILAFLGLQAAIKVELQLLQEREVQPN